MLAATVAQYVVGYGVVALVVGLVCFYRWATHDWREERKSHRTGYRSGFLGVRVGPFFLGGSRTRRR